MTKFEQRGITLQYQAESKYKAIKAFEYSCEACCCKGIHIDCDNCAIKVVHGNVVAIFDDIAKKNNGNKCKNKYRNKHENNRNKYEKHNR